MLLAHKKVILLTKVNKTIYQGFMIAGKCNSSTENSFKAIMTPQWSHWSETNLSTFTKFQPETIDDFFKKEINARYPQSFHIWSLTENRKQQEHVWLFFKYTLTNRKSRVKIQRSPKSCWPGKSRFCMLPLIINQMEFWTQCDTYFQWFHNNSL